MNEIDELTGIMNSSTFNQRGDHLISDCPFCGKKGHFYINILKFFEVLPNGRLRNCWDCKKCGKSGNAFFLMKEVGRLDFIQSYLVPLIKFDDLRENLEIDFSDTELKDLPHTKIEMPKSFARIFENEYLEADRSFRDEDFILYEVGQAKLVRKLREYVIFPLRENGEIVSYYGRYAHKFVPTGVPKYLNVDVKHSDYLYGLDDRTFLTENAIVVEGFFDKRSVDIGLNLLKDITRKTICVSSSGKSLSPVQRNKLMSVGVKNIIFGYDPDAAFNTKKAASYARAGFDSVRVAWPGDDYKDLGDKSPKQIRSIFTSDNLYDYVDFNVSKIFSKLYY